MGYPLYFIYNNITLKREESNTKIEFDFKSTFKMEDIIVNLFVLGFHGWMNKIEEMIFAELYKRDIRKKEKEELIKQMEIQKRVQDRN